MQKFSLCALLLLSQPGFAESTVYQTAPKPAPLENQQEMTIPLISVNPYTGKTRVFITPDGSSSSKLASHDAPVYHARASYTPTPAGISTSAVKLHQQMMASCPQGWIKLQEWATLQSDTPELRYQLHYQFQCLHAPKPE